MCRTSIRWRRCRKDPVPPPAGGEVTRICCRALLAFDSRARLDGFVERCSGDRSARYSAHGRGVGRAREPVQVVWRQAQLPVKKWSLTGGGDVAWAVEGAIRSAALPARCAPGAAVAGLVAQDTAEGRWLLLQLLHHLVIDHTTLELMHRKWSASSRARPSELPAPLAVSQFRGAGATGGKPSEEHEAFPARCWETWRSRRRRSGCWMCRETALESRRRADAGADAGAGDAASARELGVSAASLFTWRGRRCWRERRGERTWCFGTVLFGRMQGGRARSGCWGCSSTRCRCG